MVVNKKEVEKIQINGPFPFLSLEFFFSNYSLISGIRAHRSQVPTMDTRDKMNAKFRNEVNEALARHQSIFDQITLALQAVLTELQTLRTSHNQNSNSPEINPFRPEGPSHPHTFHSLISNSQPPHHLKLSFPRFDENDPTGSVYKVEQYFDFKDITPSQQSNWPPFTWMGSLCNGIDG